MENRLLVRRLTCEQWLLLCLSVAGLIVSFLLEVRQDDPRSVYLKGTGFQLPGTCFSKSLLKTDCPGCGMTRSIVCLSQGEFWRSLRFNPAGFFFYVCAIGYIGFVLTRTRIPAQHFLHSQRAWPSFVWMSTMLILLQWTCKLVS